MEQYRVDHAFEALKPLLSGGITLFLAWVIVRDLGVGTTFTEGSFGSVRYTSADNPIGYGIEIIFKIALMILFGAQTLHFIGVIAADPFLILEQAVQELLARR